MEVELISIEQKLLLLQRIRRDQEDTSTKVACTTSCLLNTSKQRMGIYSALGRPLREMDEEIHFRY